MKLIATYPLYKRTDASNNALPVGFINGGDAVEVIDVLFGKYLDGINTWYKAEDGYYYWSGGFAVNGFVLPGRNYFSLDADEQNELVSEAILHCYTSFKAKGIDFNGISATVKRKDNVTLGYYTITVYVAAKNDKSLVQVPAEVVYKGFSIPTDVLQVQKSEACGLSNSISRKGVNVFGTAGIVLKKKNTEYLLTNYHVACDDLLASGIYAVDETSVPANNNIVQPATIFNGNAVIGALSEARLDFFIDAALIELNVNIQNNIHGISITGVFDTGDNKVRNDLRNRRIRLWGAKTNSLLTGKLEDLNVIVDIGYNYGITKTLFGMFRATLVSPAEEGDSGAAVIDDNGMFIGLLVSKGFGDNNIYIIPSHTILKTFALNF